MFVPASGFFTGAFPVKNPQKNLHFFSLVFTGITNPAQSKILEHPFNLTLSK